MGLISVQKTGEEIDPMLTAVEEGSSSEVDLVIRACDVVGAKKVGEWMQTANPALRGQTPYSLMKSEAGRKQVETVLGRIEHGIF